MRRLALYLLLLSTLTPSAPIPAHRPPRYSRQAPPHFNDPPTLHPTPQPYVSQPTHYPFSLDPASTLLCLINSFSTRLLLLLPSPPTTYIHSVHSQATWSSTTPPTIHSLDLCSIFYLQLHPHAILSLDTHTQPHSTHLPTQTSPVHPSIHNHMMKSAYENGRKRILLNAGRAE